MDDAWLDGFEQVRGESAGTWATGPRHPKLVLHDIEGRRAESAFRAYETNRSWPHFTVDPVRRLRYQHVPINAPARALRNKPGGVETGRAPIVIQIEIVGYARESPSWAHDDLDWLGAEVIRPICQAAGIPIQTSVQFFGEDAGFTLASPTARQRLSGDAWLGYEGILGHQHVPENTHWDPGALNIDRVLRAARTTPPAPPADPGGLTMASLTDEQAKKLVQDAQHAAVMAQRCVDILEGKPDNSDGKFRPTGKATGTLLGRVRDGLARVEGFVDPRDKS